MSRDTSMHVVSPHNFLRSGEKLCRRLPACKFVSEVNLKEATFQNQHSLPDSSPPSKFVSHQKLGTNRTLGFLWVAAFFVCVPCFGGTKKHIWEQAKMAPNPTEALRKVLRIVEVFSNDWIWVMETETGLFGKTLVAFITWGNCQVPLMLSILLV